MFKLTAAQSALLHTFESAASSAIMTLIVGIWQQLATGKTSWSELFTIFASGFVAALGLIYKSVLASPVLPQAEKDTEAQAQAVGGHVASQLGTWLESRFTALENVVLFHQHPATPVPSTPPQKPVAQSNAPANVAYPQTQTITYNAGVPGTALTGGYIASTLTGKDSGPELVMQPQAQPQLLNTFPIMPAMPAPPRG